MQTKTLTPAELDTILAKAIADRDNALDAGEKAAQAIVRIDAASDLERKHYRWMSDEARAELTATLETSSKVAAEANAVIAGVNFEWSVRGGWTRYYLVTNTGGHVHSSTACGTCFPTTEYAWLTAQSGLTHAELVELAGSTACTSCFPDAPTDTLRRASRLTTPERAARAAEKAEKKAKADADKVVVEGVIDFGRRRTVTYKTLRAASQAASSARADVISWGEQHPTVPEWLTNFQVITEAIAAKTGRPLIEVRAELEKKAQATAKRRG